MDQVNSSSDYSSGSNLGDITDEDNYVNKMVKRTERGNKYPTAKTVAAGLGNRLGMLRTAAAGVVDEEGSISSRGRNTLELNKNRNRTLDQG